MDTPSAIDILRDLVADLPDEADDEAFAALAALTDPRVATAALVEQDAQERLAAATPRLAIGMFKVIPDEPFVDDAGREITGSHIEGPTDCPDCTRGTRSVGGVLVCVTLPASVGVLGGRPGDIVACGKER
jgi:hypothetical protein